MVVTGHSKRHYTEEDKALALVAMDFNLGNLHRTARELSIPRKTLAAWARGHNQSPDVANKHQLRGDALAGRLEDMCFRLLEAITPEMMRKARLIELVRVAGICVDKMLQLRGCTCGVAKGRRGLRRDAVRNQ